MRGFWLGPWMQEESGDPQRVLKEVMGLLADGTIVPEAGALSMLVANCGQLCSHQLLPYCRCAVN